MLPVSFRPFLKRLEASKREALYLALLPTCAIYNVHRTDKNQPFLTPEKFLGDGKPKPKEQTVEQMFTLAQMFNAAFGGIDKTNG